VFVNDVADADGWSNFEEVGRESMVQTGRTFVLQDGTKQAGHGCLRAIYQHCTTHKHTHTHPFKGRWSRTTRVSRYQKGKTSLDFTEARDSEWQWHQLDHMQVCTSLQTDNHASTQPLSFYRLDALPAAQPTASKQLHSID